MTNTARRPRIFIGLQEIADYYSQLQAGFEELGYDATFVSLFPHPFHGVVSGGRVPRVGRLAMNAAARGSRSPGRSRRRRFAWAIAARFLRLPLFLWAVATRDIFVLGFTSKFLDHRELALLRLLGKRVVFIFHGTDSRPPYLNGGVARPEDDVDAVIEATRRQKKRVRTIDRWADLVVDNPLAAHFHERPIVSFLAIGIPRPALPPTRRTERTERTVVRVLHCPSRPVAKGAPLIRAAVDRLRAQGIPLELVELTGVSHDVVLEALRDVDIVADQLYSDVAMAGFAAEGAAAGLPVIVGGYGRSLIEQALAGRPFPPVLFCRPEAFETALARLATDERLRRELGQRARAFVENELAPRDVAQRLLEALEGRRPEWVFDPQSTTYVHGSGLAEEEARALVRATLEHGGVEALQLRDKPALEARLVQFASGGLQ